MRAIASLDQSSSREVDGWGVSARIVGFIVYVPPVSPASALEAGPARVDVLGGADRRAPRGPPPHPRPTPPRQALPPRPRRPPRILPRGPHPPPPPRPLPHKATSPPEGRRA